MTDPIALSVSILALAVSAVTAWLTLFRRGTVEMTQPTIIFFGHDITLSGEPTNRPKIYLRALLFSTSKRGRIIESMHVSLARSETHQNFNIWVHGETNKLVRGSGLFVGETGVSMNHHFLTPEDATHFKWQAGSYRLRVHARLLGDKRQKLLFAQQLEVSTDAANRMEQEKSGLYFDWGPDSLRYIAHIAPPPATPSPEKLLEAMGIPISTRG